MGAQAEPEFSVRGSHKEKAAPSTRALCLCAETKRSSPHRVSHANIIDSIPSETQNTDGMDWGNPPLEALFGLKAFLLARPGRTPDTPGTSTCPFIQQGKYHARTRHYSPKAVILPGDRQRWNRQRVKKANHPVRARAEEEKRKLVITVPGDVPHA